MSRLILTEFDFAWTSVYWLGISSYLEFHNLSQKFMCTLLSLIGSTRHACVGHFAYLGIAGVKHNCLEQVCLSFTGAKYSCLRQGYLSHN